MPTCPPPLHSQGLRYKAVIFDIGGVVMRSPFIAIAAYERKQALPVDYINTSIVGYGSHGAWQKFERGEIDIKSFYSAFGRDLSDTVHGNKCYRKYCDRKGIPCPQLPGKLEVDGRELFGAMMRASQLYDPFMREAILRIRAAGKHRVIALTNNFARVDVPKEELDFLGWNEGVIPSHLRDLFDDFCDSSALGMRKPEPEFYLAACKRSDIRPADAIFLDDIGLNLKAAKQLGMDTIHVRIGETLDAVKILESRIGLNLTNTMSDAKL
ncbi:HAD-like domain-containing protein [Ephemerocybe angulata]|uniref:HAD-like domain-containing protein n=1 Tax=Ephemerocybe angulata TaxID=980116 RepID=A0A8H6MG32_9AGAR|nr:HAD-like domain-containing protein [Tulosesus angulatus]